MGISRLIQAIGGKMGEYMTPLLVNRDGVANYGKPTYLKDASDAITGNFAIIFAHEASVVTITSSQYDTSGDGDAPTSVPLPSGCHYVCPGTTAITLVSGKVTAYSSLLVS